MVGTASACGHYSTSHVLRRSSKLASKAGRSQVTHCQSRALDFSAVHPFHSCCFCKLPPRSPPVQGMLAFQLLMLPAGRQRTTKWQQNVRHSLSLLMITIHST